MKETKRTKSEKITEKARNEVRILMTVFGISQETGYLCENPIGSFSRTSDKGLNLYLQQMEETAVVLPDIIREQRVEQTVRALPNFEWTLNVFSYTEQCALMAMHARLMHGFFAEQQMYQNVDDRRKDEKVYVLPASVAQILFHLSKVIGMDPSLSYHLYINTPYRLSRESVIAPETIHPRFTFTGSIDEKWFIGIHMCIEALWTPAIRFLSQAALSIMEVVKHGAAELLTPLFSQTADIMEECVAVLKRMRERCDFHTYFAHVRRFYSLPRNIMFEGVPELDGVVLHLLGESGWASCIFHQLLYQLGITLKVKPDYSEGERHIPEIFRKFLHVFKESRIREFVLKYRHNGDLVEAYNRLVRGLVAFKDEHLSQVHDYITRHGEKYGTGTAPLGWLSEVRNQVASHLI